MAPLAGFVTWLIRAQRDLGTVAAHLYENSVNVNGMIIFVCTSRHFDV